MLAALLRRLMRRDTSKPIHDVVLDRAYTLMQANDFQAAAQTFALAAENSPLGANHLNDMGLCHLRLGDFDRAHDAFALALERDPGLAAAHMNLGALARQRDDPVAAETSFRRALEISPADATLWSQLSGALLNQGRADEALAPARKAIDLEPGNATHRANLIYAMVMAPSASSADLARETRAWAEQHANPSMPSASRPTPNQTPRQDAERPLRIGYISGDLRDHPVASFIEPVLAHHAAGQFEVYCYANQAREDARSTHLKTLCHAWRNIARLSDDEAAAAIKRDGIDVLVDLAGHTYGNRLLALAKRPAPVQITYLGFPASTGMRAMGFRITDAILDPPGPGDANYAETQLRMEKSLWCYRPLGEFPDPGLAPMSANGFVTFGSFNGFHKLNEALFDTWSALLRCVANARLVIATVPEGAIRQKLIARFAGKGVDASRIRLHGRLPQREFRALLKTCDIALDAFPCGGGATTCETLWMGVPLITRRGETPVSRAGASLLQSLGLEEFIAENAESYVEIAANLAGQSARIAQLRDGMRKRMQESPLMREESFTRELEQHYRGAWQRYCLGHG